MPEPTYYESHLLNAETPIFTRPQTFLMQVDKIKPHPQLAKEYFIPTYSLA